MRQETIKIEPNGATLSIFLHDDNEVRNVALIFPGGAYRYCAPGEGKPVAEAFYHEGYNSFVLEYSCTGGMFGSPQKDESVVFEEAIKDAISAFQYLQYNKDKYNIDENSICIVGFSAGANLAFFSTITGKITPLALILGYGLYRQDTIHTLGIKTNHQTIELSNHMPPVFLFACQADGTVPVEESIELARLYAEKDLPFEMHIYVTGDHGLSLGTKESGIVNQDYATWFKHAIHFIKHLKSDIPLVLGDITNDLENISVNSRIGALMYHEEAWKMIEELLPEVANKAKEDMHMRSYPLIRFYQWGMIKEPSLDKINEMLKRFQ